MTLVFDTAWDAPRPILTALIELIETEMGCECSISCDHEDEDETEVIRTMSASACEEPIIPALTDQTAESQNPVLH